MPAIVCSFSFSSAGSGNVRVSGGYDQFGCFPVLLCSLKCAMFPGPCLSLQCLACTPNLHHHHPPHPHHPSPPLPSSVGLQRSRLKSTAALQLLKYRFYCRWDPALLLCTFLTPKHTVIQLYVLRCTWIHSLTHAMLQTLNIFYSSIRPFVMKFILLLELAVMTQTLFLITPSPPALVSMWSLTLSLGLITMFALEMLHKERRLWSTVMLPCQQLSGA